MADPSPRRRVVEPGPVELQVGFHLDFATGPGVAAQGCGHRGGNVSEAVIGYGFPGTGVALNVAERAQVVGQVPVGGKRGGIGIDSGEDLVNNVAAKVTSFQRTIRIEVREDVPVFQANGGGLKVVPAVQDESVDDGGLGTIAISVYDRFNPRPIWIVKRTFKGFLLFHFLGTLFL